MFWQRRQKVNIIVKLVMCKKVICAGIIKNEQIKKVKRAKGFGAGRGVAKYSTE